MNFHAKYTRRQNDITPRTPAAFSNRAQNFSSVSCSMFAFPRNFCKKNSTSQELLSLHSIVEVIHFLNIVYAFTCKTTFMADVHLNAVLHFEIFCHLISSLLNLGKFVSFWWHYMLVVQLSHHNVVNLIIRAIHVKCSRPK